MDRRTFPFNPPELPGFQEKKISREIKKFPGPSTSLAITTEGVKVTESNSYAKLSSEEVKNHKYSATTTFGHHLPENDIHPMRLRRIPAYQRSSQEYGRHYRHPQQEYTRILNLRSPALNADVSKSNQDRFRVETRLMSE